MLAKKNGEVQYFKNELETLLGELQRSTLKKRV
jgi:hypothetical protein